MYWKLKAKIQNVISHLPSSVSYTSYYWMQRYFGGLKQFNPTSRLTAAISTWKRIQKYGENPSGKTFLEVGTGRVPLVPLAYWLMGAEKTITIDLNPYLRKELVVMSLKYIAENRDKILNIFGSLLDAERFDKLQSFSLNSHFSLSALLNLCQINYIAPGNAANTYFPDNSVDFHTSIAVFEHIPFEVLKLILEEENRLVKSNGLFVHRINYSDHFSFTDKTISAINFLKYSDNEWKRFADNRYMYMNRLRHDDFISLFKSVGHQIVLSQPNTDQHLLELLRTGTLPLANRFSVKSNDILAITGAWVVSKRAVR